MGINLGAFFSPLICGTLGQKVGWHWGFGAAGVGMCLGLVVYYFGNRLLPRDVIKHEGAHVVEKQKLTRDEWLRVGALCFLCLLNIMFWGVYEQQGNTLQLWANERTNWNFFGWQIPSTWFQAFNPAMIFIFAPVLNIVWAWQARRGSEPSSITKMGVGCILCGAAYVLMILAARAVPENERGHVLWLVGTVFIFTMGELYLSPIGLSLVTKVAPRRIISMMMGVWFLSSFFGNYMTGFLGTFYSVMSKDSFFLMLCMIGVSTGLVFLLVRAPLQRIIGKDV
jgi:POT family proton-dependent oligopeptide transporter